MAEERYSADYVEPHLQETQEVLLIFANESAGSTSWGVLLPTRSCKAGDRYAMEDVGMFMHWALGYSHAFSYHKERGQFHTNLVSGPPAPPPDMSSFPSVTFTMPDVPVVLGEGLVACIYLQIRVIAFPRFDGRRERCDEPLHLRYL